MLKLVRVSVVTSLAFGSLALVSMAPSGAAPVWAPAATAAIHPGVQTLTTGAQCTANFVFTDASNVYIGQAAHCSGTGGNTETNGCTSASLPIGTPVTVTGATKPGTLVYNSWLTMQARGETDADTCQFNDLALVRLDPADVGKVNPSVPHWGGPNGLAATGTAAGQTVYSYGNSSLRGGVTQLSPKTGVSLGGAGGGWSHNVATVSPGIPGDSGSAFLDSTARRSVCSARSSWRQFLRRTAWATSLESSRTCTRTPRSPPSSHSAPSRSIPTSCPSASGSHAGSSSVAGCGLRGATSVTPR
ncbi:MAG: serine protease [Acidimicrobiia bacterium]